MRFTFRPQGVFSLDAVQRWLFGFVATDQPESDDFVWAFLSDEGEPVAVRLRQGRSTVTAEVVEGGGEPARLRAQIARIMSIDHDGRPFDELDDPVIARLRAAHPGLRPVLFPTPYESAVWAILSHRTQRQQSGNIRRWLADEHGTTFELDGHVHRTMIPPEVLVDLRRIPGVPGPKLPWLRGVARATLEGDLDPEHLLAMAPEESLRSLRRMDGIGPYSAEFVLTKGAGHPDVFARHEPLLTRLLEQHYGTADPSVTDRWRPRRSWAGFLLRSAS